MPAKLASGAVFGVDAYRVEVEVDLALGVPQFTVVGLPDNAVNEAKERVRAAMRNSGFDFPNRRITVNLAPGDVKKAGPLFDLPIALGMLAASGQLESEHLASFVVVGELALDGGVRPVAGVLPIVMGAYQQGLTAAIVPAANAGEAELVTGMHVYPVASLAEAVAVLIAPAARPPRVPDARHLDMAPPEGGPDFAEVRGQVHAKRALEIGASGMHNMCLIGPPGSGKTMLARRLPGILPPLTMAEALEITRIHSVAGLLPAHGGLIATRPFRAPHHGATTVSLVGGTAIPRPGEVALAHLGVLFLDEMAEFRRDALEQLRQPLEDGQLTVCRANATATFPAQITLVAAMNPCPCGYRGDGVRECVCAPQQADRYWNKLSGPLLDRIDLHVMVPRLGQDELMETALAEPSSAVRARVIAARTVQVDRFAGSGVTANARMGHKQLREHCALDGEGRALLRQAISRLGLSGRAHDRILKVARTIADLEGSKNLGPAHLAEAIQYRALDRQV